MIGIGRWSILNRCYEDQRPFPFRYRRIARTRRRKSGAHGSAQTRRGRPAEPVARRRSLARLQRSSGSQRWWTLAATSFRRLARAQTTRTGRPEASATCSGRGPPVSGWARSGSSWLRTARCLCSTIPPSSRPRILRSWKSGLSRTHQTSLPERDHDSVINDVITQNASNKSSIQLISRAELKVRIHSPPAGSQVRTALTWRAIGQKNQIYAGSPGSHERHTPLSGPTRQLP